MNEYILNQLKEMFEMAINKELTVKCIQHIAEFPIGNNPAPTPNSYLHYYRIEGCLEIKFKITNQKKENNV